MTSDTAPDMQRRRRLPVPVLVATGTAVAVVYVIAAFVTAGAHRPVRPLFEGSGPPPPYQWVNPPARFAPGNVHPQKITVPIAIKDGATITASVATSDGQFLANFGAGAITGKGADTVVNATVTPLDPATLSPVPAGLAADGNAYRLDLVYGPSGQGVTELTKPGNVVMTVPVHATALLFSTDGKSWQTLDSQAVAGTPTIGAALQRPGYYLPAGPPDQVPVAGAGSKSNTGRTLLIILGTVVLAAALGLGPVLLRRRSRGRRRPPPKKGRPQARPQSPPMSPGRPRGAGGASKRPPPKKRKR